MNRVPTIIISILLICQSVFGLAPRPLSQCPDKWEKLLPLYLQNEVEKGKGTIGSRMTVALAKWNRDNKYSPITFTSPMDIEGLQAIRFKMGDKAGIIKGWTKQGYVYTIVKYDPWEAVLPELLPSMFNPRLIGEIGKAL